MMNSTANDDAFEDNPFRPAGTRDDLFFDASTQPDPLLQNNQQQPQFQQAPPQQPFQDQPQAQPDMFVPQQTDGFLPPSGPMAAMAPAQQQAAPQMVASTSWWGNCMMCLSLDSYRAYFDIDANDIVTRIKAVMLDFYKPEHFRNNVLGIRKTDSLKGPDLYGPFWITTTLIFFIGVTSNMHDYFHRSDIQEFDYDINHLLHAASILLSYSFVLPAILWITTQCLNMQALLLVDWVCLYGYSLVPFMPAVVICIIPFGLVSWITLMMATLVSCSLVVRNVAAPLLSSDVGQAKAPPILLAILGTHGIFFFFLKFSFYHHKRG